MIFLRISIIFIATQVILIPLGFLLNSGVIGSYLGAARSLLFDPITLLVSLINGFLFGYFKPNYKLFILTTFILITLVTLLIINPYRAKLNLSVNFFDFSLFVRTNVSLFWSSIAIIGSNLIMRIK